MLDLLACAFAFGVVVRGDGASDAVPARPAPPVDALFGRTYFRELALAPDGSRALAFEVSSGPNAQGPSLVELAFHEGEEVGRTAYALPDDSWSSVEWDPASGTAAFLRGAPPRTEVWLQSAGAAPKRALQENDTGTIFDLFWRRTETSSELLVLRVSTNGPRRAVLSRVDFEHGELVGDLWPFGAFTIKEATIAPDGRHLAIVGTMTPTYAPEGEPLDLIVVDLEAGTERALSHGSCICSQPRFSPDSRQVACIVKADDNLLSSTKRDIVLFDCDQPTQRTLTAGLDLSIGDGVLGTPEALWFLDERTLLTATQHGLADHVLAIELPDSTGTTAARCRFVREDPVSWQKLAVSAAARRVVAIESGPSEPERIVAARWPRMEARVIESPNDGLDPVLIGEYAVVRFAGAEGWPIEGLLVTPPGLGPFPTVFVLHGGSSGRSTLRFNDGFVQTLTSLGYAAFAPNLRGSSGYGVAFNRANEGDFGGKELDDLDAAVAAIVDRGVADPKRLFLFGHSYGGFLAEMALVRSRRFAAACAASAVSDWEAFVRGSDLAALAFLGLGGAPEERPSKYAERSPLLHVDRIKTPLLLVHGARDGRVPISQSEWLDAALRRAGTPSELVRFPSVGHVLRGPETSAQWLRAADEWFRAHSPAAAAGATPPDGLGTERK
jgi:dipeptidyl aminopeptidase/acylaminoacyl peptidase